jgi:hypothetical protein
VGADAHTSEASVPTRVKAQEKPEKKEKKLTVASSDVYDPGTWMGDPESTTF